MSTLTLIPAGNSAGVILPKEILRELGVGVDDTRHGVHTPADEAAPRHRLPRGLRDREPSGLLAGLLAGLGRPA